jgi:hypothetical protein
LFGAIFGEGLGDHAKDSDQGVQPTDAQTNDTEVLVGYHRVAVLSRSPRKGRWK